MMFPAIESLRPQIEAELANLSPAPDPALYQQLVQVSLLSEYFFKHLVRDPEETGLLLAALHLERSKADYLGLLADADVNNLDSLLRQRRRQEMCRIIFRDLTRIATLEDTTADLSNLADACIEVALKVHYQHNCERYGVPIGKDSGLPQEMAVLALGKLGAGELNLSSDIDLVFLYDEPGEVRGGNGKQLTNLEFFIRTARSLIASLDRVDQEGFVFRVDMRLRPFGISGSLIMHRAAMEKYFVEQGRDWERYAFIKARPCAGNLVLGNEFLQALSPFVYRRHLDFGAIDSLREMKRLINYEVDVKQLQDDLKLGHGGIREVEFIAQACQIVWGGQEIHLRERRLLRVLSMLANDGLLPAEDVERLLVAYRFLRNSEHVIQAEADQQTQRLPKAPLSLERLALGMGFVDTGSYLEALTLHRNAVRACFSNLMGSNRADGETPVAGSQFWNLVWQDPGSTSSLEKIAGAGFQHPQAVADQLKAFEAELKKTDVHELGVQRIDRLLPVLLALVAEEADPDTTLSRLLPLIETTARRSTYIAFLLENVDALRRTVHLCALSPWVAEQVQTFPILLYELSDRSTQDAVFDRERLAGEMHQLVQNLAPGDLEAQMDSLRQFKHGAVLKVAVFELLELLPLMKASDALTHIAELVLNRAFELAWTYLVERHGSPCSRDGEDFGESFAIVAYGKLGGIELGYGSDLDLVFLHDADIRGRTNGEREIENSVFFSRLGQRIVHILTSYTHFGVLYEVDLRLRPDGNKGPLVSTFSAYERYLNEEAWTWEHQALVRARFVAGNPALRSRFAEIRHRVLARSRDRDSLRQDVLMMREKMRGHLDKSESPSTLETEGNQVLLSGFDLKQGAGAIVDIEFMVQFAVLEKSCEYPELTRWTDKMRILDDLDELGIFSAGEVKVLQEAYLLYRTAVHYRWLGGAPVVTDQLIELRARVVEIWQRYMSGSELPSG